MKNGARLLTETNVMEEAGLKEAILKHAEYLFSSTNLSKDNSLRALMDQDASKQGSSFSRVL